MSHSEKCPVCNGTGSVPSGFYNWPYNCCNALTTETCHSCNGKGYITIEDKIEMETKFVTNNIDLSKPINFHERNENE